MEEGRSRVHVELQTKQHKYDHLFIYYEYETRGLTANASSKAACSQHHQDKTEIIIKETINFPDFGEKYFTFLSVSSASNEKIYLFAHYDQLEHILTSEAQ